MISRREITKKDISIPHPDPQSCLLYTSYSFTEAEGGQYLFNCTNVNLLRWFSVPGSRWPGSDIQEKMNLIPIQNKCIWFIIMFLKRWSINLLEETFDFSGILDPWVFFRLNQKQSIFKFRIQIREPEREWRIKIIYNIKSI